MIRKQFTFYRSFWECAKNLPTKNEKLQFFEMLCDYALNEIEPDLSTKKPSAATAFRLVQPTLATAHARAEAAICSHSSSKISANNCSS